MHPTILRVVQVMSHVFGLNMLPDLSLIDSRLGCGFRVQGSGLRVQGLGFTDLGTDTSDDSLSHERGLWL